MTIVAVQTRCNRCHRRISDPRWCAVGLGRVCAGRLGLVLRRERKVRARQPVRAGGGDVQPSLLDLLEPGNEINDESGER